MFKIQITIAIPVYNADSYLRDAIQSVINQTYKDWILYLINDGSTDGSLSIMQKFAEQDSRIIIINDEQNKGLISRLNQSIAVCNTKYYVRMDADDIMCITRLEEQVKFLEEHPDVDVCGTSIMTIDSGNNIIGSGLSEGKVSGFVHPTVMGKTSWFKTNPYSSWAVRAEDKELWCRTAIKSNFWAIEKPLLFYREFGVPTLKKTLISYKTLIKIYSRYKEYNYSLIWCIKNILITVVKSLLYIFFASIGQMDYLIAKRTRVQIPKEQWLTDNDLQDSISS